MEVIPVAVTPWKGGVNEENRWQGRQSMQNIATSLNPAQGKAADSAKL